MIEGEGETVLKNRSASSLRNREKEREREENAALPADAKNVTNFVCFANLPSARICV